MKKVVVLMSALLLIAVVCYADQQSGVGGNTNTNTATATGGAGGSASNSVGNVSGLGNKSFSPSADANVDNNVDVNNKVSNKQQQGQVQGQKQTAVGKVDTNVSGDKVTAFGAPSYGAGPVGTSTTQVFSLWGGASVQETEEYKACIEKLSAIKAMQDCGWLTPDQAKLEAVNAYAQLREASKPKRWLGIGPKDRGRHLLNLFGFLDFSSPMREGSTDMDKVLNGDMVVPKHAAGAKAEPVAKTQPTTNYNK